MQRAISQVYEDINLIIDSVSPADSTSFKPDSAGKAGDIRIHKDSLDNYGLQVRTNEGWASTYPREGGSITPLAGGATLGNVITKVNEILDNLGLKLKERTK